MWHKNPNQQLLPVIKPKQTHSPNPKRSCTKQTLTKNQNPFLKKKTFFLFSTTAGEMNIPASLTSSSMNNARLSDHRRHVFHETSQLQIITSLA